jgi:CelD/BcsL family acetyltransferase involved in cellulose biosynthesis
MVTLAPISERYNTHGDLLLSAASENLVGALVNALFSLRYPWDMFRISRLIEGSPLTGCLEEQLRRSQARFRSRLEAPSFVLPLPRSYDDYLAQRSGKFRNFLRRAEKRLARQGRIEFLRAGVDVDVEAGYTALFQIETRSWKHAHGTAISAIRHQQDFYRDLCRGMFESGRLHLTFLRIEGTPIAYNLGLVLGDTYYYLKTSFDEAFRAHSPATVVRSRLLASLIESGITAFDFPGEPYEFEAQWTRDVQWHRSLLVFNRTRRGQFYGMLCRLRDSRRKASPEGVIAYVDPRDLKPPGRR